jgi:hypothetical protein
MVARVLTVAPTERKGSERRSDGFSKLLALNSSRMSTKEILLEVAQKLPTEATLADAIYELEFRQAVEQRLAELDRGEGIPIEDVKQMIQQWAHKPSYQF